MRSSLIRMKDELNPQSNWRHGDSQFSWSFSVFSIVSVSVYVFTMKDVFVVLIIAVISIVNVDSFGELPNRIFSLFPIFNRSECVTPNDKPGECVRLNTCKSLRERIRKVPLTDYDRSFLKQSQCDYVNNYPWVCCPDKVQVTTPKPTRSSKVNHNRNQASASSLPDPGNSICGRVPGQLPRRIIGGEETFIGEFPWMAVLVYEKREILNHRRALWK